MNLNQVKLSKNEWANVEIPNEKDKEVLSFIIKATDNINLSYNKHTSLLQILKIESSLIGLSQNAKEKYIEEMDLYVYKIIFATKINKIITNSTNGILLEFIQPEMTDKNIKLNKQNKLRIDICITKEKLLENTSISNNSRIYEFVLLDIITKLSLLNLLNPNTNLLFSKLYFTLYKLNNNSVLLINKYIREITNFILNKLLPQVNTKYIIEYSLDIIEKNTLLLKYADLTLYKHQKDILSIFNNPYFEQNLLAFKDNEPEKIIPQPAKLILYISPTGTGKTMTPIALSKKYRVIYICAARHVGLALARASITMDKKIAFAFGCQSVDDIRLHYFSAKEYTKNKKSGGILKVDNSNGEKVELMICDIKSYLYAMNYMNAFNPLENLLLFFDEPTISLDYETHELHTYIKELWQKNIIKNIVLSSATLPKIEELTDTIASFQAKFPNNEIHNILSFDCKKSIQIIDKCGFVVLPHYITPNYNELLDIVDYCSSNLTILRYFDLQEVVNFIMYLENNAIINEELYINNVFLELENISMENIKLHYLNLIRHIPEELWQNIYQYVKLNQHRKLTPNDNSQITKHASFDTYLTSSSREKCGEPLQKMHSCSIPIVSNLKIGKEQEQDQDQEEQRLLSILKSCGTDITTKDAHTLTDGPTIFLTENVNKIVKFCIQQANIPVLAMNNIMDKIQSNNMITEKISELEEALEVLEKKKNETCADKTVENKKKGGKSSKFKELDDRDKGFNKLNAELERYKKLIKSIELNETFIPNKPLHIKKWVYNKDTTNCFTSDIDEKIIIDIMSLSNVNNSWKLLLLMGIGVFHVEANVQYIEIMKKLADVQKLFIVIASSDYIYGTNYQFAHCYISKDMNLTQEKIMQAMGRVGRNNIQQSYTVRLRDDEQIKKIFYKEDNKIEVRNMNMLFS